MLNIELKTSLTFLKIVVSPGFPILKNNDKQRKSEIVKVKNIKILVIIGFLVYLVLICCRLSHTVDTWEGWCSQLLGEDLYEKYNTFVIGFDDAAIRDDFVQEYNQLIVDRITELYLGGKKPKDDIVVNELVRLKMIGVWNEGNDLYLANCLLIIDNELGIDEFEVWANNFREFLDIKRNRDKLDNFQYCIYGTINTHFENFIFIGPDDRTTKITLEFTRKKELK